jgi:hypothetical protein
MHGAYERDYIPTESERAEYGALVARADACNREGWSQGEEDQLRALRELAAHGTAYAGVRMHTRERAGLFADVLACVEVAEIFAG